MDKILIVEDDEIIQKLIEYRVKALGYPVCGKAGSAEEAIFCAKETNPDVILMDIRLNGMLDGIDAAKIIRKSMNSRIIFLTAFTDDAMLERVKTVHPEGFIEKPFNDTDLRVALTPVSPGPLPLLTVPASYNPATRPGNDNRTIEIALSCPHYGQQGRNSPISIHLFIVSPAVVYIIPMMSTGKKIRMIRDKLSRIGIGEKGLDDETLLASYSINSCGNLCPVPRVH